MQCHNGFDTTRKHAKAAQYNDYMYLHFLLDVAKIDSKIMLQSQKPIGCNPLQNHTLHLFVHEMKVHQL